MMAKYWLSIGNIIGYARSSSFDFKQCKNPCDHSLFTYQSLDLNNFFFELQKFSKSRSQTIICKLQAIFFSGMMMMCVCVSGIFCVSQLKFAKMNCSLQTHHYLTRSKQWKKAWKKKRQATEWLCRPSTNQNNGSSSSLKLYRFNGVVLQLSDAE